jgi:formate hydrogenlyase transcriptional activator
MSRGQALGILAAGRREDLAYTADETDFLVQVSSQLGAAIQSAVLHGELQRLKRRFEEERVYPENEIRSELKFPEIIGKSSVLQHVLRQIEVVAPTDSGVLIQGETGTGKELIARAIHNLSARRDMPFIKVNCAAIPSGLLESELSREKGAALAPLAKSRPLRARDKNSFLDGG